jgi:hypothetical protein
VKRDMLGKQKAKTVGNRGSRRALLPSSEVDWHCGTHTPLEAKENRQWKQEKIRCIMSNGFTVEAIVAQIRSRIADENARRLSPSQTSVLVTEKPSWDLMRSRQRMEEETARFAALDSRLENAARNIGQQPAAPPTWRGRFGACIVQGLRRLLWWYGLPIKDSIAQICYRNRQQAICHRYVQADLLALGESLQRAVSRIDRLEQAYSEAQDLQRSIADCQTRVGLLAEQVESSLKELRKGQDIAAKDAGRKLPDPREGG